MCLAVRFIWMAVGGEERRRMKCEVGSGGWRASAVSKISLDNVTLIG